MFPKIMTETLIEIEELQKQFQTLKKTSGKLQKEEIRLYRKLQTLLHKKNKEILARFKKEGLPSNDMDRKILVQPLIEAKEEYSKIVLENTAEAIRRGMRRAVEELNKLDFGEKSLKAKIGFGFIDTFSPEVSEHIKEHTFEASQRTMDRLTGDVMDNLRQSYEKGYGYDKAAQSLNEVFRDMETSEMEMIARTEIGAHENLGMHEANIELGVEYEMWRNARDERVRDSHRDLDRQITRAGGRFSNGLEYPGDRSGPIEEWINCRCTLMPYILPEGYVAPSSQYFYEGDLVPIDSIEEKPDITVGHGGNLISDESQRKYIKELYEKKGYSIDETKLAEVQQSIDEYSTRYYRNVRKYNELGETKFREWIEKSFSEYDEDYWNILINNTKRIVNSLDDFLEKTPSYPQETVFKGLRILPTDGEKIFKVGGTFTEKSFASFSSEQSQASRFGDTILQVINKKGKSIKSISAHPEEFEILMPKNITYKVVNVYREGGGRDIVLKVSLEVIE